MLLLDGVAGIMRMAAHQKDIEFVFDAPGDMPATVEADEKHLRQVLLNLLGNAVKFTDQGNVTLRVRIIDNCKLRTDNRQSSVVSFQFSVQDTGIGMAPGELAKIFESFGQVGDAEKRAEGTGLGLAKACVASRIRAEIRIPEAHKASFALWGWYIMSKLLTEEYHCETNKIIFLGHDYPMANEFGHYPCQGTCHLNR